MLMGQEEFCGVGIEAGVEKLTGRGDVDFSVFHAEIVAMNGKCGGGKQQEAKDGKTPAGVQGNVRVHGALWRVRAKRRGGLELG
jgi:hypothetical protein